MVAYIQEIFSSEFLLTQGEHLLRLLVALSCGAAIGYERQNRMKEPGIRTHIIVSLAAAMMMMISKYGFYDVIAIEGIDLDPSRIAAGIVTAIGFLGAGAIFVRNQTVIGLTTSAGMWATVGVGMAIGANMYVLGIAATLLILIIQLLLHRNFRFLQAHSVEYSITFMLEDTTEAITKLREFLEEKQLEMVKFSCKRTENTDLKVNASIRFPRAATNWELLALMQEANFIKGIEI